MVGSAEEQSTSPAADDSSTGWTDGAHRLWFRFMVFVAHWRLRLAVAWSIVTHALRRAWRYYLRSSRRSDVDTGRGSRHTLLLPSGPDLQPLPEPRDGIGSETDTGDRPTEGSLPSSRHARRELQAGDCSLDVERTPDRLTISDPAHDEAYLSSTVWVDVEE